MIESKITEIRGEIEGIEKVSTYLRALYRYTIFSVASQCLIDACIVVP